jgi:hypothetical protein
MCTHNSSITLTNTTLFKATSGLNEDQAQIYTTALGFAREKLLPYAGEWDQKEIFPGTAK